MPSTNSHARDSGTTEVLHGFEKTTQAIMRFLNTSRVSMNICADFTWPSVAKRVEAFNKGISDLKIRNVKLRFITEMTKDNIEYCKELMQISELRHLDMIKGNFAVSEKEFTSWATLQEASLLEQIIYSNVKAINEQQQYVFETLWTKAKPAEQKIREIEGHINLGNTELIHSTKKILDLFMSMIKSAKSEILLMLPTINAFLREERIGAIELLNILATEHDVNVRIITPTNDVIEKILQAIESAKVRKDEKIKNKKKKGFEVQRSNIQFKETSMTTVTILVVDNKESLAMEKTDDSKENFVEAIGLSTYSNSGPTVMSYISMFESLWRQAGLYEELWEANRQLQIHDKMQREFINIASHEMKTPTQAILGTTGLLQHYPEKREELIEIIGRNAKRLQTLISNILDVTRIESQTLILNKERFNMHDLISFVTEEYKERKKNINIKFINKDKNNSNPSPILVEADRDRIIQVLSNLLDNAIKFTNQGEISINLFERIDDNKGEQTGKVVIVSVTDTGSGINSEIFNRLFTKFTSRSYQGTGLGLFICKSIIEAHGGRIWAQNNNINEENSGATITFSLPGAMYTRIVN
ncbi:MAG TPA: HAMP domain-containing sensor histidine kinase [Nitrososphaeraceae archaeon]|nr:HAMP domain-containing sensor histidine kinase [Nitrososphaeraceae archaeon]